MYNEIQQKLKKIIVLTVVLSLVLGGLSGFFAGFILRPLLNQTDFGQNFLLQNLGDDTNLPTKYVQIKEDSATIEVVKKVSPAVVSIVVTKELAAYNFTGPLSPFEDFFNSPNYSNDSKIKKEVGGGTGFIISSDGLILTNKHVVVDAKAEYTVITNDGEKYVAKVLAKDVVTDIAVLQIEAESLAVAEIGNSQGLEIGQTVIAIGNTLAEFRNTVTKGVVSGINRRVVAGNGYGQSEIIEKAIQTDAAINPGNSGGPLLNLSGQVIGINSAVSSNGQSVGFAIPIDSAKTVIESVKKYGKIVRPWLGVRYVLINSELKEANSLNYDYGALVVRGNNKIDLAVIPGSPADKAGLTENDIILEINNIKIDESNSLSSLISDKSPGDEIEVKVFSKDEEKMVKVTLEERENN